MKMNFTACTKERVLDFDSNFRVFKKTAQNISVDGQKYPLKKCDNCCMKGKPLVPQKSKSGEILQFNIK